MLVLNGMPQVAQSGGDGEAVADPVGAQRLKLAGFLAEAASKGLELMLSYPTETPSRPRAVPSHVSFWS